MAAVSVAAAMETGPSDRSGASAPNDAGATVAQAGSGEQGAAFRRLYPAEYYARFLAQTPPIRPDGRPLGQTRPLSIGLGFITTADASVIVKVGPMENGSHCTWFCQGDTVVIGTCRGVHTPASTHDSRPDHGMMHCICLW